MKIFICQCIVSFLLTFLTMTTGLNDALATQALNWYSEEYPPYNFTNKKDNRPVGISVDYLVEIFRNLNSDQTRKDIKMVPWSRGYNLAQQKGEKNAIFVCTRTKEREKIFKWVGPVSPTKIVLFAKEGAKKISTLPKNDPSTRFAVIRDDIGQTILLQNGIKSDNLIETSTIEQMLDLVKIGRAKYIAYEENVLKYKLKHLQNNPPKLSVVHTLKSGELWYALNVAVSDDVVQGYQKAFDDVLANKNLVDKIKSRYQD